MSAVVLSESEREALAKLRWDVTVADLAEAVEAIIAARLAPIEALAAEWEGLASTLCDGCESCDGGRRLALEHVVHQLRAALTGAGDENGEGA